jgi:hypothetical protein
MMEQIPPLRSLTRGEKEKLIEMLASQLKSKQRETNQLVTKNSKLAGEL